MDNQNEGIQELLDFAEQVRTQPDAFPPGVLDTLQLAIGQARQLQETLGDLGLTLQIVGGKSEGSSAIQLEQVELMLLNPDLTLEDRVQLLQLKKILTD